MKCIQKCFWNDGGAVVFRLSPAAAHGMRHSMFAVVDVSLHFIPFYFIHFFKITAFFFLAELLFGFGAFRHLTIPFNARQLQLQLQHIIQQFRILSFYSRVHLNFNFLKTSCERAPRIADLIIRIITNAPALVGLRRAQCSPIEQDSSVCVCVSTTLGITTLHSGNIYDY